FVLDFVVCRILLPRELLSFPTRRSSDLMGLAVANLVAKPHSVAAPYTAEGGSCPSFCSLQLLPNSPNVAVDSSHGSGNCRLDLEDRKSTRLNSSHQIISYAVFCLKKKNT